MYIDATQTRRVHYVTAWVKMARVTAMLSRLSNVDFNKLDLKSTLKPLSACVLLLFTDWTRDPFWHGCPLIML